MILLFLTIFILLFISAYFRVPLFIWSFLLLVTFVIFSLYHPYVWILTGLFLIFFLVLNLPFLRRFFFSDWILSKLKQRLPQISETEKAVLEAGNVWWEQALFCGKPNWKELLNFPYVVLTEEEQSFLNNQVQTLCAMIDDWQTVQRRDLAESVWDYLKKERFWGLMIPKKYGGHGFSAYTHSTIISIIASRSYSAAMTMMVPNSVGLAEFIIHYGTEDQKNYYLSRFVTGEEIPCFALTSPEAGSDASAMTDSGIVCYGEFENQKTLGIRLNWDKRYITLAPVATVIGLAFKLYDPEHLLGDKTEIGITLAMIPSQLPGIEMGKRHWPLYMGFHNGPIRGHDVFIPLSYLIGGPEKRGQGWTMMMECLSVGRGISLPALSTAIAKKSYRTTSAYVKVREQFHMSIGCFEGIQEALARIAGYTYLCEATRLLTASAIDQDLKPSVATAISKYHLTEMSRKIINHAMDIHGGRSIQVGPRNYLAHFYIAAPISITVEGANILTRNLIIFGQGALRCHPYVRKEMLALQDSNEVRGGKFFDHLLVKHVGYTLRNLFRAWFYGLTNGCWIKAPKTTSKSQRPIIQNYYRQLTRMSTALAVVTDFALLMLGGELKRKERLSARLGDVLSYLYLSSSALKFYETYPKDNSDFIFIDWVLTYCLSQIQTAFNEFFENFPMRWVAVWLSIVIFPWGRKYKKPTDFQDHCLAMEMMSPTLFRNRITEYCYTGNEKDIEWQLEKIFQMREEIQPFYERIQKAIKKGEIPNKKSLMQQLEIAKEKHILDEEEIKLLLEWERGRFEVIRVDEFTDLKKMD